MKRSFTLLLLFVSAYWSQATAQTLANLETKYGAPVKLYSVDEHTWMAPEFADDGQLCMVRLFPKQIDPENNYLWNSLPLYEVKDVFDQLAPPANRGKKGDDQGFFVAGRMAFRFFQYENVRVTFITSDFVSSNKAERETKLPSTPADDEFPGPYVRSAQIVTISWNHRKCSQPKSP